MKKLLVITGGSKGIGHATAKKFIQQGFDVTSISRSPSLIEGVRNESADLSNPDWDISLGKKLKTLAAQYDQICLVHCAADLRKDSIRDVQSQTLQQVLQVSVVASCQLNQLLLPYMDKGSSIIYIGSTLSEKAVPNSCSYVTSKHAIAGLMKATCQDLAGSGIHTACVCPGFTDTEMLRAHVGGSDQVLNSIASNNGYGRLIQSDEIAETIHFCALNPVVNGAVLHANLGQLES